jgi:alkylhydroperoxidase/carboxymuconolactone decarboxylase family protein YurZ
MAQKRRTPRKQSEPQARVQEIQQRTNEMQAAFQQVAQRYGVRHLVIVVGDDQGLHSFTASCEGWIAQALDRLVRQALAAVGMAAQGGVESVARHLRGAVARDEIRPGRIDPPAGTAAKDEHSDPRKLN